MNDLFEIPPSLSPRLAWIKKHGLTIRHDSKIQPDAEDEFSGERLYPFVVYAGEFPRDGIFAGNRGAWGDSEDEALVAWAKSHGIKLWNEENL